MGVRLDRSDDGLTENHEINVTPFIDVMLVLLIIFMVAAPLATVDVPVDLPASNAAPQERPEEPLYLTLKSDLSLVLGNSAVALNELTPALDRATGNDRDRRIFFRADRTVSYEALMEVLNSLRSSGYLKVALVGREEVRR